MRIFITGLTGTLGTALAKLHRERGDEVLGCARSESKAVEWFRSNPDHGKITLVIGDAADMLSPITPVWWAMRFADRLYHCAAVKHVDLCEANPSEAVKQNVELTRIVASVCQDEGVGSLVLASTDKAFRAEGVYGATKLLAERIVLQNGGAVVRLGNIIGSSGSVFQHWANAVKEGNRIQVTDPEMTRYFMTAKAAAQFMADYAVPGRVVVPSSLRAVKIGDVAQAISGFGNYPDSNRDLDIIGPRPGETRHQWLDDFHCSDKAESWNIKELLREAGIV